MKPAGLLERLDDALNPIVVKELRQAVHSRFVTAVLMFFLIVQLLYIGIHLMFVAAGGQVESTEFQAGREVFTALQVILLATCMLFLPLYAGIRLAAERSEVNTDLLFITTLKPRAIISGKLVSSIILALLIFSACAPFMIFTFFLRGIDWPMIGMIITMDFLVVIGSVQIMIFLAVVPANRVLKAFLGLIGFGLLMFIFGMTLTGSMLLLWEPMGMLFQGRDFWTACGAAVLGVVGAGGLLFTWSIALVSPAISNRAPSVRLFMLGFWLVSGAYMIWGSWYCGDEAPVALWAGAMILLGSLGIFIAVNEREHWAPRVARSIPQNWLLRLLVFPFFSGAAGGVLFATLLIGATVGVVFGFRESNVLAARAFVPAWDLLLDTIGVTGILALYVYSYALTAVLVRSWIFRTLPPSMTWVVILILIAVGSLVPFLVSYLISIDAYWRYDTHFAALLANPAAGMLEMGMGFRSNHAEAYLYFTATWAILVTSLNLPWFFGQFLRFRPLTTKPSAPISVAPSDLTAAPHDSTRTAPSAR